MTETIISIKDQKISQHLNKKNIIDKDRVFDYLINLTGKIYRKVKSRRTEEIKIDGVSYFIKKHFPISLKEFFKNIINLNNPFVNAGNEYQAIVALNKLGINTLDVAALASRTKIRFYSTGKLGSTSFLVTKAINPNIELDKFCELLIYDRNYYKLKRLLINHISATTKVMHQNGLNHRDYYLCHYLINVDVCKVPEVKQDLQHLGDLQLFKNDLLNKIYLIDLHRMQIRAITPRRYIIKDLSALLFSVRNLNLTRTDKLRFVKNYAQGSSLLKEHIFWQDVLNKAASLTEKG